MSKKYLGNLDLTGQIFGRLTVIRKVPKSRSRWLCKCICGNEKEVIASQLLNGYVRSCGCLEKENIEHLSERIIKHGMTNTILYKKWCGMKERCYNPHYRYFSRYGGRGIKICPEWLGEHGFEHFAKWAYSVGYDDSKHGYEQSIDRKDTDGDYCPENCKWSNQLEQVKNRSNSFLITDTDGEELTHVQFSKKHGIPPKLLFVYRRMKRGLSASEIIHEWEEFKIVNNGDYLKIPEFAQLNGVANETVKLWINKKKITAYQVRRVWYIPKNQAKPC